MKAKTSLFITLLLVSISIYSQNDIHNWNNKDLVKTSIIKSKHNHNVDDTTYVNNLKNKDLKHFKSNSNDTTIIINNWNRHNYIPIYQYNDNKKLYNSRSNFYKYKMHKNMHKNKFNHKYFKNYKHKVLKELDSIDCSSISLSNNINLELKNINNI